MSISRDPRKPKFYYGPRSFFRGMRYVVTHPATWGLAIVPAAVALALFGAGSFAGFSLATSAAERWLGHGEGKTGEALFQLVRLLLIAIAVFLSFLVSVTFAQPLSGPAIDALCKRRWAALGASLVESESGWVAGVWRSLQVNLAGLFVGGGLILLLSCVTLLVPPAAIVTVPLKVLVGAMVISWDVLDYPFSLKERVLSERVRFFKKNTLHVLLFGLTCEAALLIPGVGLLVLPMAAVGATDLFFGLTSRRSSEIPPA